MEVLPAYTLSAERLRSFPGPLSSLELVKNALYITRQKHRAKYNHIVFYLVILALQALLSEPAPEPSTASPELNVFVRPFSGLRWSFRVSAEATIGNLKTIIHEKFPQKVPADVSTWRLTLSEGPFLSDNTSLVSAGVLDNCTLFMKTPASPELNVFVRPFCGATLIFRVRGDTKIGDFKTIIRKKFSNAPTDVTTWRLIAPSYLTGPFLSDNISLTEAGVLDDCTLHMTSWMRGGSGSASASVSASKKRAPKRQRVYPNCTEKVDDVRCKRRAVRCGDIKDKCHMHGGGLRCQHDDCVAKEKVEPGKGKVAIGKTGLCKLHGGGNRCQHPDCTTDDSAFPGRGNSARHKSDFCKKHGGGKRCIGIPDGKRCTKTAQGATDKCFACGGGTQCIVTLHDGTRCTKSGQGPSGKCVACGGGVRCQHPECVAKDQVKPGSGNSAVGGTGLCKSHGGGRRCPNCIDWIDSQSVKSKYDGYCARCFKHAFPTDPRCNVTYVTRVRNLVHQTAIEKLLYAAFPGTIDREVHIDYACVKKGGVKGAVDRNHARLDFVIYHIGAGEVKGVVVVECDEDEHEMYGQLCESVRMFNVTQSLRDSGTTAPVAWVRFNPDEFQINGIEQEVSAEVRQKALVDTVRSINFDDGVAERILYLFYSQTSVAGKLMPCSVLDGEFNSVVKAWCK